MILPHFAFGFTDLIFFCWLVFGKDKEKFNKMLISWAIPHQEKRSSRLGGGVNCQIWSTISVSKPNSVSFWAIFQDGIFLGKLTWFFSQFQGTYITLFFW
jgi:hypothetical protein